jgi:hypothetical protein
MAAVLALATAWREGKGEGGKRNRGGCDTF